jgi:NAD(P)-dependent dehydrogenase (short-subunit alcohol dehydrogenase family)
MPTALITGANRGLGLEFARQYAADGWSVIATARNPGAAGTLSSLSGDIRVEPLELGDFAAVEAFGRKLAGTPLDLLLANAGRTGPETIATAADAEGCLETIAVNAVAPTLLAQALAPDVIAARGKLVAITSQMGSIADNSSGGWLSYRASKAALNMAWRTLAIDFAREPVAIALLHPGWVRTDMGGRGAPMEPRESVAALRRVIAGLTPRQKGVFLNYRGETLPW